MKTFSESFSVISEGIARMAISWVPIKSNSNPSSYSCVELFSIVIASISPIVITAGISSI